MRELLTERKALGRAWSRFRPTSLVNAVELLEKDPTLSKLADAFNETWTEERQELEDGKRDWMHEAYEFLLMVWSSSLWYRFSCPVFDVDPSLAADLCMTRAPDVEIRLPFQSFVVRTTGLGEILHSNGLPFTSFSVLDYETGNDETFRRMGVEAFQQHDRDVGRFVQLSQDRATGEDPAADQTDNLIKNLSLFMAQAGIKPKTPRPNVKKSRRAVTITRVRDTGPVKIPGQGPGLFEASTRTGPVRASHVVRGHWRNARVGTGRAERRIVWIRPHWRGDESAGTKDDRVYRVST